jgi:hypothetical protein
VIESGDANTTIGASVQSQSYHVLELIAPGPNYLETDYAYIAPPFIYLDNPDDTAGNEEMIRIGRGSKESRVNYALSLIKDGKQYIYRVHAEIVKTNLAGGEEDEEEEEEGAPGSQVYQIRDCKALNGLFVNDVRITNQTLHRGDIVQFGGVSVSALFRSGSQACSEFMWMFARLCTAEAAGRSRLSSLGCVHSLSICRSTSRNGF